MPFNPKSLENLGKPRTKAGRKNFLLSQKAIDWLANQSNQSAAIEALISQQIMREKTKMTYEFRNLTTIEDREFDAADLTEALNLVSKAWFDGSKVVDFVRDNSSRITLLSNRANGNVIGKIYIYD